MHIFSGYYCLKRCSSRALNYPIRTLLGCQGHGSKVLRSFIVIPTHSVSNINLWQRCCHGQEQYWPVRHLNTLGQSFTLPCLWSCCSLSLKCPSTFVYLVRTSLYSLLLPDPSLAEITPFSMTPRLLKVRITSYLSLKSQELMEDLACRRKSMIA